MLRNNFPQTFFLLAGISMLAGCASMSDYHYEHTQKMRARSQYRECGQPTCSSYPSDYKKGWLDGFYEVSTGGSSCPPAIAPSCYWKPEQIIEDCDNRRHAYYSGWQDGATRAMQFPDTHYLKVFETCECPFPRCQCNFCGQTPCGCMSGGECETHGMALQPGIIEQDRQIMMLPIPDEAESEPSPSQASDAGSNRTDDSIVPPQTPAAPPLIEDPSDSANKSAEELVPPRPTRTELPATGEDVPSPSDNLPASSGGEVNPESSETSGNAEPAELQQRETANDSVAATRGSVAERSSEDDSMASVTYRYGNDNSQTIEFDAFDDGDRFRARRDPRMRFPDLGLIELK